MANRLAHESSLYLHQHADNPVDWYPWGEEALARARRERRPILLSIGYSACHWCHVMAHESFEDDATAAVMNANYINIKVDREQRPDLDRIYQFAHQALTRRGGGWPLTVFLAPDDLVPFYAGTYFPPQARHGLPSFVEVLHGVRRWFEQNPQQLVQQNAALAEFLAAHGRDAAHAADLDDTPLRIARQHIESGFDPDNGGHRGGPKFPPCTELELLLQLGRHGDRDAASMATLTLQRIAERGLQDHLGGGFFRYCVDAHWGIPHFEKMLYDNAALLAVFADAASSDVARANETEFIHAAEGIVAWLQREMQLPDAGYASAIDADSEGEEGLYYLWKRDEVERLLTADDVSGFMHRYGLDLAPNFEGSAWHLQRRQPLPPGVDFQTERGRLLQHRGTRVAPARDDKRLTSWNAMLLRALARASRQLQRPDWQLAADTILESLRHRAWNGVRLCAVADGAHGAGFLDDHAYLLDALLESLQSQWRDTDLAFARDLADTLLRDFEDSELGGFFFTAHDHETLPQRPKPWFDEATPSGNAIAARALLRLGHLVGEPRYLFAAERTLRAGWNTLRETPHGACALLGVLHEFLHPTRVVVLRADPGIASDWRDARHAALLAGAGVYTLPDASELLPDKRPASGGVAYVCVGMRCLAPATTPHALSERLAEAEG